MEIKIADSCFSRSISTDDMSVISGMTDSDNADESVPILVSLYEKIINKIDEQTLRSQWEMTIIDWEEDKPIQYPALEQMQLDVLDFIKKESQKEENGRLIFGILFDALDSFNPLTEESNYCEGCGDTNYYKKIFIRDNNP